MRKIHYIIVHCTDSPDNMDIGVKEIDEWHKLRGWSGIGYHCVIRKGGSREEGRGHNEVGAHAYGHNKDSLAVVWVGKYDLQDLQRVSLVSEIVEWMLAYDVPISNVLGHCELPNVTKTCPNLNMNLIRNLCEKLYDEITI